MIIERELHDNRQTAWEGAIRGYDLGQALEFAAATFPAMSLTTIDNTPGIGWCGWHVEIMNGFRTDGDNRTNCILLNNIYPVTVFLAHAQANAANLEELDRFLKALRDLLLARIKFWTRNNQHDRWMPFS